MLLNIKNISKYDPDPVGFCLFWVTRIRIRSLKTGSADPDPDSKKWTGSATLLATNTNQAARQCIDQSTRRIQRSLYDLMAIVEFQVKFTVIFNKLGYM